MSRFIHIVWSRNTGPLYAFISSDLMHRTAMAISGVEVMTLPVLDQLPEVIRDDIECDFDGDDETPEVAIVDVEDIDED